MKRLTYLLAVLAIVATSCQNNNYTINGTTTYENIDGAQVILFYGDKSDTTHVTGNTFSFTVEVEMSDIGMIRIDNTQRKMMNCYFVLESDTLDIEVSPSSTCSGTPLNEIYTGYQTRKRKIAEERSTALKQVQGAYHLLKRKRMPVFKVYEKYKGDKFEIVGVAVWDDRKDTEEILSKLPITWPIIYDAQKIPTDIYGINGIPQIILFAPDGTIVARDLRGEAITKKLETLERYL